MPLITPQDLIDYTVFDEVKTRLPTNLTNDIIEAEAEIYQVIGHSFEDTTTYPTLPEDAKVAYLKLAQFYALVNSDKATVKGYSGEKIGDYSYTYKGDTLNKPEFYHLVSKYIKQTSARKQVKFRMSSL